MRTPSHWAPRWSANDIWAFFFPDSLSLWCAFSKTNTLCPETPEVCCGEFSYGTFVMTTGRWNSTQMYRHRLCWPGLSAISRPDSRSRSPARQKAHCKHARQGNQNFSRTLPTELLSNVMTPLSPFWQIQVNLLLVFEFGKPFNSQLEFFGLQFSLFACSLLRCLLEAPSHCT